MAEDEREIEWLLREKWNSEKSEGFFADCARLDAGEPLAYVIGFAPFLNAKIWLDSKPLIPRPETEYWAAKAIEYIREIVKNERREVVSLNGEHSEIPGALHILDLCAGSGAIGVAVAKALSEVRVDFAEIDAHHHKTITDNICGNGIDFTSTRIFGGDLFSDIPRGVKYDVILSNPPYIDPSLDRAEASVKQHEPHLALYGGEYGMEIISRIIRSAPQYLEKNGQLWIEHEPEQADEIATLSMTHYASCSSHTDQYDAVRYSVLSV